MDVRRPSPGEGSDGSKPGGDDEPPPILGRWSVLYGVLIAELLLVIGLCHWLTRWNR